jgi:RNA:NAD 2'-phosphotransferase (TPT1/KptA family)
MTEQTVTKQPRRPYARERQQKPQIAMEDTIADAPAPRTSKMSKVVALLKREQGATLEQMIDATGWLPHTTRAALTGLRKKGHDLSSEKIDGARIYRIANGGSPA